MDRKIRVFFDANPLAKQKTGVGYYTEGVVKALAEIPQLELVGFYFGQRRPVSGLPKGDTLSYRTCPWLVGQMVRALRKIGIRLPWELLARQKADVLFFPDFTLWPSLFGKPKLLAIHDLTYIDLPQYVRKRNLKYLQRYVKRDAKKADLVLTISEFSKSRIVDALGVPAGKVLVEPIPPAQPVSPKNNSKLPKKFILFISTIEPRKNLDNLVEAYNLLSDDIRDDCALVIAGGEGWDSKETIARLKQLQSEGLNIILSGYVDGATRAAMYSRATAVIVPSFYEGFGMPILEAMSYGAPVVASNLAVFKEIAGDAALYFDPNSVDSIRVSLIKIISSDDLRKTLVEKGSAKLKNYSWQAVAEDIYKKIEKLTS